MEYWKITNFGKNYKLLTNKGCFFEDQISIEVNDEPVSDGKTFAEILNEHYVSMVEKSSGTKRY